MRRWFSSIASLRNHGMMFDGTGLACVRLSLPIATFWSLQTFSPLALNVLTLQQSISHISFRDADIWLPYPNVQTSLRSHFEPVDHDIRLPREDYQHQTLVWRKDRTCTKESFPVYMLYGSPKCKRVSKELASRSTCISKVISQIIVVHEKALRAPGSLRIG
jgi:hypothetical protein